MPKIKGQWAPAGVEKPNSFKYYIAIDDLASSDTFSEADPDPLLRLLAKNDASANSPFKLDTGSGLYPVCSSPDVAMVLGFHAWKRPGLKLVEMGYQGLIRGTAPYVHPMGSFWLIQQAGMSAMQPLSWKFT